jgi:hypothetical protein
MTKRIEVLDALPGCGKTTAIIKYMSENRGKPYLYLSPMKKEIEERVPLELDKTGLDMFIAADGAEDKTKTLQVLLALQEGNNIACTHALMMRFTDQHFDFIAKHNYQVVCDEELDLIKAFNVVRQGDIELLLEGNYISISETDGKITLSEQNKIPEGTKYTEFAAYVRLGCVYAAKGRRNFLITQIPPKLMDSADRFILLTYLYEGSIMQTFMKFHGYSHQKFELPLRYSITERKQQLKQLISFIETPAVMKVRSLALSSKWYEAITQENMSRLEKSFSTIVRNQKASPDYVMFTLPKSNITGRSSETQTARKRFNPRSYNVEKSFVASTARATNDFRHKTLAIHMLNIYPSQPVVVYLQDMSFVCDSDGHALSTFIQWLFRGCIRDGEPMKLAIFSKRMDNLFKTWLNDA